MVILLPTITVLGFRFSTFPFVIFGALVASVATFMCAHKYKKFYRITIFKLSLPVLAFAAFGARLFSAITLMTISDQSFWHNLIYGGSIFYGGMIGGAVGLFVVCQVKHYEFLVFSDLFVTLLPIGHGIGRLGCYLNGCCYGKQYDGIFAVDFIIDGIRTTVFPTWFFEAGFCCAIFIYFQLIHKNNATGSRTAIYLISYSIYRFLIEFMRGDEIRGHIGYLSSSQIISLFVLVIGLGILYVSIKDNCENYLFIKERGNNANESIS